MNDFSKEELIKIKDVMYGISFDDNEERLLRNKIQSMIAGYCEHVWTDDGEGNTECENCRISIYD